jgi:hypothetical protein
MITVKDAILSLVSNCAFSLENEKIINWISEHQQPTETEINAELIRLQAEYNSTEYQRLRAEEYPPVTDYLDAVVKGDLAQQQAYIDACLAVKAKYPKPEGL